MNMSHSPPNIMSTVKPQIVYPETAQAKERRKQPLGSAVHTALSYYFRDLDGHTPGNLYDMVLQEVERPLFEAVMRHARGNQSKAAKLLGINRSTLRKKLEQYGIE